MTFKSFILQFLGSHPPSKKQLTYFLTVWLDINYLFFCSPFRLTYYLDPVTNRGRFRIKSWWPHALLCGLLTLVTTFWILQGARFCYGKSTPQSLQDPTVLFEAALQFANVLWLMVSIKQLWWNQQKFLTILNFTLCAFDEHLTEYDSWKTRLLSTFICLVYTGFALIDASGVRSRQVYQLRSCAWIYNGTLSNMKANMSTKERGFDIYDFVMVPVLNIGWFHRRIFGALAETLLLMASFTVWGAVRNFCGSLSTISSEFQNLETPPLKVFREHNHVIIKVTKELQLNCWTIIHQEYRSLKKLSEVINSTLGTNMTCLLMVCVLHYAIGLDQVLVENGISQGSYYLTRTLFYLFQRCAIVLLAADIGRQMGVFKKWILEEENRAQVIPFSQAFYVVNELDSNIVAIRASSVFPVTYGLAANMLGITVTYLIICVQGSGVSKPDE